MIDVTFKDNPSELLRNLYMEAEKLHEWLVENLPDGFIIAVTPQPDISIMVELRAKVGQYKRFFGREELLKTQIMLFVKKWSH